MILGLLIGGGAYYSNSQSASENENSIANCTRIPLKDSKTVMMHELFDPLQPPEGAEFYKKEGTATTANDNTDGIMTAEEYLEEKYPGRSIWTETNFDVDSDGSDERILTANVAMNHTPHVLKIVKDDYVIFEYEAAGISVEEVEDNDGFLLWETIDWIKDIRKATRYEYNSGRITGGGFTPVWYRENCN